MEETSLDEIRQILNAIGNLRTEACWLIGILAVLAFIFFMVRLALNHRKNRTAEAAKTDRADKYAGALDRLSEAMKTHIVSSDEQNKRIIDALDGFSRSSSQLHGTISILIERTSGTINAEDTRKIINHAFQKRLYLNMCFVIENSLRGNNFKLYHEHIKRKVKTAIGDAIAEVRTYLGGLKLSENTEKLFVLIPKQPAERFLLCDLVWDEMEPLFLREPTAGGEGAKECPEAMTQKVEEAFLIIENIINDYLYMAFGETRDRRGEPRGSATALIKQTTRLMGVGMEDKKEA